MLGLIQKIKSPSVSGFRQHVDGVASILYYIACRMLLTNRRAFSMLRMQVPILTSYAVAVG